MTMCGRKEIILFIFQASKTGMAFGRSSLACQMISLSGSGNYTLPRIKDGMTVTNG